MGRWLTVRVVAWGLRGGISIDEIDRHVQRRFRHRDWTWRAGVYEDARARNARRQKIRA